MARKRMVDPLMFSSETVASLPVSTRWTWVGMLCYLDDTGRGKDNAALVKAAVWPLDEAYGARKVAADIEKLVNAGSLCRYQCCGTSQLHVPTWTNWQKVQHPTPTRLCPCAGHEPKAHRLHMTETRTARDALVSGSGESHRNVVEVSSGQSSSSDPGQADAAPCPHGHSSHRLCADCRRGFTAATA